MLGLRKLRFVDIGTGLSMMLGTAGMLAASALSAADTCAPSGSCTQAAPQCCDGIFADAAARLNSLYAGLQGDNCAAPAAAPAAATSCGSAAGGCAATEGCSSGCCSGFLLNSSGDPLTLTDLFDDECGKNHFKDNGWKLGGNLAQSYTMNFNNPQSRFNGPVTWTDQSNQYQMNQFWLYAEKATDTSTKDWDFGGRADALYGTSARLTTESGLETPNIDRNGSVYGLALPQFYGEMAYKKLKVKVGHFISPIGYFTVDTTQNFFNTIPYTYQWGEPFTHTGALATYQFTDNLVVSSGVTRGWDNFDGHNPHLGYLGTWAYTFPDKSNLAQVIVLGQEPTANLSMLPGQSIFTQRYYQSLVYTKPIDDNWTYVGQTDFGTQRDATVAHFGDPTNKRANWYGLNQYLYYKVNDKWTWGANFEWWRDEEGYRVASFLPGPATSSQNMAPSGITGNMKGIPLGALPGGYTGNFYQTTIGPRWYPTGKPNFFIRPNFRYDWYQGGTDSTLNPLALKPYSDGAKSQQALFVTDVCILF